MTSYPLGGIIVDPAGQTVGVNITTPAGGSVVAYTDRLGASQATIPGTISAPTTYFLAPGPYRVIANDYVYNTVIEGSQIATVSAATTPQIATPNSADVTIPIASSGANCVLDLSLGTVFLVTLTAPIVNITFTNANELRGNTLRIILQQDGTGGRYVTWPTSVIWDRGAVPALTQTATTGTDVVTFRTVNNGGTWYGSGGVATIPGVDPNTIPGCFGVWEGWAQPQALNSLANTTIYDRVGTNGRTANNALRNGTNGFDLKDGWVPTKPLPSYLPGGRRIIDISAYANTTQFLYPGSATLSFASWTVIYSREQLDTTNANGAGVEIQTGSGKLGLRTVASGNPYIPSVGGGSAAYSGLAANQFTQRHIIAMTWDGTTGRFFYGDDAPTAFAAQTPSAGPNPWLGATMTQVSINTNDASPFNAKNRFGGVAVFGAAAGPSGALDFSTVSSPGWLAARWIAALAGIAV